LRLHRSCFKTFRYGRRVAIADAGDRGQGRRHWRSSYKSPAVGRRHTDVDSIDPTTTVYGKLTDTGQRTRIVSRRKRSRPKTPDHAVPDHVMKDPYEIEIRAAQARTDWESEEKKQEWIAALRDLRTEARQYPQIAKKRVGFSEAKRALTDAIERLIALESDIGPRTLQKGVEEWGLKGHAKIRFRPKTCLRTSRVYFVRPSQSLIAAWRSVARQLGGVDETQLKPVTFEVLTLPDKPSKRVSKVNIVSEKTLDKLNRELDSTLATNRHQMHANPSDVAQEKGRNINLPNVAAALQDIMADPGTYRRDQKIAKFVGQIKAAHAIRHKRSKVHDRFMVVLKILCEQLGHPPTKRQLAEELSISEKLSISPARISQLCAETGFDWLPTEPPGRVQGKFIV